MNFDFVGEPLKMEMNAKISAPTSLRPEPPPLPRQTWCLFYGRLHSHCSAGSHLRARFEILSEPLARVSPINISPRLGEVTRRADNAIQGGHRRRSLRGWAITIRERRKIAFRRPLRKRWVGRRFIETSDRRCSTFESTLGD